MGNYNFLKTDIDDVYIIEAEACKDKRGFFIESYTDKEFAKNINSRKFVEEVHYMSYKGVVRGLHFQKTTPQSKLVRVINGGIYYVYVDIRKNSKTFGQWRGVYISKENGKQIYIPAGFAHGFLSLSDNTDVISKSDEFYCPEYIDGIIWNDNILKINWNVTDPIISDEDLMLGSFQDFIMNNN